MSVVHHTRYTLVVHCRPCCNLHMIIIGTCLYVHWLLLSVKSIFLILRKVVEANWSWNAPSTWKETMGATVLAKVTDSCVIMCSAWNNPEFKTCVTLHAMHVCSTSQTRSTRLNAMTSCYPSTRKPHSRLQRALHFSTGDRMQSLVLV